MSGPDDKDGQGPDLDPGPELVSAPRLPDASAAPDLSHLAENRGMIVRRSLLATAVGGAIPLPVLDDYFSARIKAGMLMRIAERRGVDLAPSSAELLADPWEGTTARHVTLGVAALVALKFAWRKMFALMAIGRRAEEMAISFQLGVLFDHYCARLHLGGGLERTRADELRAAIHGALAESEREGLVAAFRDGSRVLGQSMAEAPTWIGERIERAARRWAETGGRSHDPGEAGPAGGGAGAGGDAPPEVTDADEARWLDRAAGAVESRLGRVGQSYLVVLVRAFERRWRETEARRKPVAPAADARSG